MVYNYNDPVSKTALPTYAISPDCGNNIQMKFSYTLEMQDGSSVPAEFLIVGSEFVVAKNDNLARGSYLLKVVATEINTGLVNSEAVFTV